MFSIITQILWLCSLAEESHQAKLALGRCPGRHFDLEQWNTLQKKEPSTCSCGLDTPSSFSDFLFAGMKETCWLTFSDACNTNASSTGPECTRTAMILGFMLYLHVTFKLTVGLVHSSVIFLILFTFLLGFHQTKCNRVHLRECYFPQWGMKSSFFCGAEGEKI